MWLKKYITILHRTCINWVKIIQCIGYQYRPLYELKILDKQIMDKNTYLSITMQRLRHFSIILQLPPKQASHGAGHRHYLGRILYTDQPNISLQNILCYLWQLTRGVHFPVIIGITVGITDLLKCIQAHSEYLSIVFMLWKACYTTSFE